MSYQKDNQSKYWQKDFDSDLAVILDDEDTIDRLLINTDFDAIDIPESAAQQNLFTSSESLPDIKVFEDIREPQVILEPIVENTSSIIVEPEPLIWDKEIEAVHSATVPEVEIFVENIEAAHHEDPAPCFVDNAEHRKPLETLTSLVDNHTTVEKVAITDAFIIDNFLGKNPIERREEKPALHNHTQQFDSSKRIEISVGVEIATTHHQQTNTNQASQNTEWLLFKAEQENINTQQKNRIATLEKSLRKAMLFSLLALLLSGLSLIAVVSLLV